MNVHACMHACIALPQLYPGTSVQAAHLGRGRLVLVIRNRNRWLRLAAHVRQALEAAVRPVGGGDARLLDTVRTRRHPVHPGALARLARRLWVEFRAIGLACCRDKARGSAGWRDRRGLQHLFGQSLACRDTAPRHQLVDARGVVQAQRRQRVQPHRPRMFEQRRGPSTRRCRQWWRCMCGSHGMREGYCCEVQLPGLPWLQRGRRGQRHGARVSPAGHIDASWTAVARNALRRRQSGDRLNIHGAEPALATGDTRPDSRLNLHSSCTRGCLARIFILRSVT